MSKSEPETRPEAQTPSQCVGCEQGYPLRFDSVTGKTMHYRYGTGHWSDCTAAAQREASPDAKTKAILAVLEVIYEMDALGDLPEEFSGELIDQLRAAQMGLDAIPEGSKWQREASVAPPPKYMTPLQEAAQGVEILRKYGILPTDLHRHVGENGVRCEFCEQPSFAAIHDPERLGRGTAPQASVAEQPTPQAMRDALDTILTNASIADKTHEEYQESLEILCHYVSERETLARNEALEQHIKAVCPYCRVTEETKDVDPTPHFTERRYIPNNGEFEGWLHHDKWGYVFQCHAGELWALKSGAGR